MRTMNSIPPRPMDQWLGGGSFLTFGVNILRIEINPAVPLNRIEGDADPLEPVQIFDSLEDAEIKEWLHVKDTLLAVFKDQKEGVVIPGNHFFNGKVHGGAHPTDQKIPIKGHLT